MGGMHRGSSPSPFDAIDGGRLAGPDGSHPLHDVRLGELVRPSSGEARAEFRLDRPAVVGEGLTGAVRLVADRAINARAASLRLVGLRLVEQQRSESRKVGERTESESWVQADGSLFVADAFLEPRIPARLAAGEAFEGSFALPMPRLGPPTAHLGEAIVAWALEVRWDVSMASDPFVATLLPLAQNPSLQRAGVGRQGGAALLASITTKDGAQIDVHSTLPAAPGTELVVQPRWPTAPSGRGARVELVRTTSAPNGMSGTVASAAMSIDDLRSGGATARIALPHGLAPSFDGAGLELRYAVRVVVDIALRPDASTERPVSVG